MNKTNVHTKISAQQKKDRLEKEKLDQKNKLEELQKSLHVPVIEKKKRTYGWKKDIVNNNIDDNEYHKITTSLNKLQTVSSIDMRPICPPVYDQQNLGSCSANALAAAYEIDQILQHELSPFVPSRLFIYYNERSIEGTINEDSGAVISDGVKSLCVNGVCPETMWQYNTKLFEEKPFDDCYSVGTHHLVTNGLRVKQTLNDLKHVLVNGFPFIFGFTVFESFEGDDIAKTGIMTMPKHGEQNLGGHAVLCVGFNDDKKVFIVRNSWGDSWGDKGYFYMPYAYMINHNFANDFWTIKSVSDN